jgi:hypothetical protein
MMGSGNFTEKLPRRLWNSLKESNCLNWKYGLWVKLKGIKTKKDETNDDKYGRRCQELR